MNSRPKLLTKILLATVGVFVLGCITGASLDSLYRIYARSSVAAAAKPEKEDFLVTIKRTLDLNEQQAKDISAIVEGTRGDYRQLRVEVRPRYDALRQQARARIRALLTPAQQAKFDVMVAERDARRAEEEKAETRP